MHCVLKPVRQVLIPSQMQAVTSWSTGPNSLYHCTLTSFNCLTNTCSTIHEAPRCISEANAEGVTFAGG